MKPGLIALGVALAWAWIETFLGWNYLSSRKRRYIWPQSEIQWRLPLLLFVTAIFAWGVWRSW